MYMADTSKWYLERITWLIAGLIVLISLGLAVSVSLWFLLLTLLVGVNLTVFALTGFCPMAVILHSLGVRPRCGK